MNALFCTMGTLGIAIIFVKFPENPEISGKSSLTASLWHQFRKIKQGGWGKVILIWTEVFVSKIKRRRCFCFVFQNGGQRLFINFKIREKIFEWWNIPVNLPTTTLSQAILPVVSNKACQSKNSRVIPIPITSSMICGGDGGETARSGCHGDSGGPFVCKVSRI